MSDEPKNLNKLMASITIDDGHPLFLPEGPTTIRLVAPDGTVEAEGEYWAKTLDGGGTTFLPMDRA